MKIHPSSQITAEGTLRIDDFRFYGGRKNNDASKIYVRDLEAHPQVGELIFTNRVRFENLGKLLFFATHQAVCLFDDNAIYSAKNTIEIRSPIVRITNMGTFCNQDGDTPLELFCNRYVGESPTFCIMENGTVPAHMRIMGFEHAAFNIIAEKNCEINSIAIWCQNITANQILGTVRLCADNLTVGEINGTLILKPSNEREPMSVLHVDHLNGNIYAPGAVVKLRNLPEKPEKGRCAIHADTLILEQNDAVKLNRLNEETYRRAMDWNVKKLLIFGATVATNSAKNGLSPLSLAARATLEDQQRGCDGT